MNKFGYGIIGFMFGAAIGAISTKVYFEGKYSRIAQEEIDSVKEVYGRKYTPVEKDVEDGIIRKPVLLKPPIKPEEKKKYIQVIKTNGYDGDSDFPSEEGDPKVISPEEFGLEDDFDTVSLTFFADGVLADDNYHAMSKDEIEASVGSESLNHFGEYEDYSVFVRNEKHKTDYEILKDERNYEEVIRKDKEG